MAAAAHFDGPSVKLRHDYVGSERWPEDMVFRGTPGLILDAEGQGEFHAEDALFDASKTMTLDAEGIYIDATSHVEAITIESGLLMNDGIIVDGAHLEDLSNVVSRDSGVHFLAKERIAWLGRDVELSSMQRLSVDASSVQVHLLTLLLHSLVFARWPLVTMRTFT